MTAEFDLYTDTDYRSAIKSCLQIRQKADRKRYTSRSLAKACRVQPPYLSAAMHKRVHLNSDQLFSAINFLGLIPKDREYITTLFEWERSSYSERKSELADRLELMRNSSRETASALRSPVVNSNSADWQRYFLNPDYQLIHLALTNPRISKEPKLLARELNVTDKSISSALELLQKLELITPASPGFRVIKDALHLPEQSDFADLYRKVMRIKALQKTIDPNETQYSVLFTSDEKTAAAIHREFLKFLQTAEELAKKAPSKNIYQLNFDLLRWTKTS